MRQTTTQVSMLQFLPPLYLSFISFARPLLSSMLPTDSWQALSVVTALERGAWVAANISSLTFNNQPVHLTFAGVPKPTPDDHIALYIPGGPGIYTNSLILTCPVTLNIGCLSQLLQRLSPMHQWRFV